MEISKLLQVLGIMILFIVLLLLSGCANKAVVTTTSKPIVINNTHNVEKKLILPSKPVCNIEDNLLDVNWYYFQDNTGKLVTTLYVIKEIDLRSLSYNINELKNCISMYNKYIKVIEDIVDKYNGRHQDNESSNIR